MDLPILAHFQKIPSSLKKKIINQEAGNILLPCFQLLLFIYFSFYLNAMVLFPLVTAGVDLDIPGLYDSNVSLGLWEGVWVCVSISKSVHQLFFFKATRWLQQAKSKKVSTCFCTKHILPVDGIPLRFVPDQNYLQNVW